jgi:hypothetical protein
MTAIGADYDQVVSGNQVLSDVQMGQLLDITATRAKGWARQAVPTFDKHPEIVQKVIADMAYNLGADGLKGFEETVELINQGKYLEASGEMLDSEWAREVGDRAIRLSKEMASAKPMPTVERKVYTPPSANAYLPTQSTPKASPTVTPKYQPNVVTNDKGISVVASGANTPAPVKVAEQPAEQSRIAEAIQTITEEGWGAFMTQMSNYISTKADEKTGKEDIIIDYKKGTKELIIDTPKKTEVAAKPEMPKMKILADTVRQDGDRVFVPVAINTEKSKFDYRNRGQEKDIPKTTGAYFSTYAPFRPTTDFIGKKEKGLSGTNKSSDAVIALNTKTGKVEAGTFDKFKGKPEYVVSKTLPAKAVKAIEINKNAKYFEGIAQKGLTVVYAAGKKQDLPIGLGNKGDGNGLTGWSGGKMFITKPDGTEGYFVYGTVKHLQKELENYKKVHKVDHVLWYDMDHKAFSQAYQTKTGKIKGSDAVAMDNTNSSGGNFLYMTE